MIIKKFLCDAYRFFLKRKFHVIQVFDPAFMLCFILIAHKSLLLKESCNNAFIITLNRGVNIAWIYLNLNILIFIGYPPGIIILIGGDSTDIA